jgi:hypothetical protein
MAKIKPDSGTTEPTSGARYCESCKRYVRADECGASFETVAHYAAATTMWPCVLRDAPADAAKAGG